VRVLRSIPVDEGNSAAVGFIYGAIVSAASGLVRVIGDWIEAIDNRVSGLQAKCSAR
jgi:hypothetical protein